MGDSDDDFEADSYTLFIYSVSMDLTSRPNENNVYEWVQNNGKLCRGANDKYKNSNGGIQFAKGQIFRFFFALRKLIGMDLFPLLGTTLEDAEASSQDEQNLICGSLPTEVVSITVLKIKHWLENYEKQQQAYEKVKDFGFEKSWFIAAIEMFAASLEESNSRGGMTMGIVE